MNETIPEPLKLVVQDLMTLLEESEEQGANTFAKTIIEDYLPRLLVDLPQGYPQATLTQDNEEYTLAIGHTIIYNRASASDVIKHTKHYVEARKKSPDLPLGVIYGIYD